MHPRVRVACFLIDLHGDMRVIQDRLETFLKEHKMALDPSTEQKLNELTQAIVDEAAELKGMITAGNDPTEINSRLDSLISSVKGISDTVKAV